jgi:hypothetical protein
LISTGTDGNILHGTEIPFRKKPERIVFIPSGLPSFSWNIICMKAFDETKAEDNIMFPRWMN